MERIRTPLDNKPKRPDGRSTRVRRWHKLHRQFLDEIGISVDRMSEGQRQLLAALVDCALQMELQRERICNNQVVDPISTTRLARTLRALSVQLGLET
jgi:hypothetical protein